MQISKQVKIVGVGIVFVVITITLIVLIDELDFVARWLRHIEPYKDNIEHIIYACLIVILILNVMRKLKALGFGKTVKTLKANFNGFGFEVEFSDREVAANMQCEESASGKGVLKEKLSIQIQHGCYASVWERKIISILSTELQLDFATNTVLRRGECRYIPDGFAVKNGRAYIWRYCAIENFCRYGAGNENISCHSYSLRGDRPSYRIFSGKDQRRKSRRRNRIYP